MSKRNDNKTGHRAGKQANKQASKQIGDTGWFDKRGNVNKIVYALCALCVLLLVIDPLVHKHGPFDIEHLWGFYGIYGFVACVALVLAAKVLRKLLMRPEDYYDR